MLFHVGSRYFHASISHDQINNILKSPILPEMSIWEKIKDFFCFTHQTDALKCIHQLCHPPAGTTIDNVKTLFERLQKLAHPGDAGNIQIFRDRLNHFSITDKAGKEILSVVFADDYTVTTGGRTTYSDDGSALSYPLTENNCVSNVQINNTLISDIPPGFMG
ncbi:hypothetical protein [Morganella morganii]|uniref:hypothetical protein n=1 Tax=Morganella morganii TaxID=582 RepID=UPI0004691E02|nr:hypothetical protein [Morganella morganii]